MIENKIAEMLGQLADKLGVASAKIWEWSLLQVKVDIARDIIIILLAILTTVAFAKLLKRLMIFPMFLRRLPLLGWLF